MERILFATDFSPAADAAFAYAAGLALHFDSELLIAHVTSPDPLVAHSPGDLLQRALEEQRQQLLQEMQRYEALFVSIYGEEVAPLRMQFEVATGLVVDQLLYLVEEKGIDAMVIGTHAKQHIREWIFGTHAEAIVTRSTVPVFAIPPGAAYHPVKHIAYGTDFRDLDDKALRQLLAVCDSYQAQLTVLHIDTLQGMAGEDELYHFREMVSELFGKERVAFAFPDNPDIVIGMEEYADENGGDLLAIKHRRGGLLQQLLRPSVSRRIVQYTTRPLLILAD